MKIVIILLLLTSLICSREYMLGYSLNYNTPIGCKGGIFTDDKLLCGTIDIKNGEFLRNGDEEIIYPDNTSYLLLCGTKPTYATIGIMVKTTENLYIYGGFGTKYECVKYFDNHDVLVKQDLYFDYNYNCGFNYQFDFMYLELGYEDGTISFGVGIHG